MDDLNLSSREFESAIAEALRSMLARSFDQIRLEGNAFATSARIGQDIGFGTYDINELYAVAPWFRQLREAQAKLRSQVNKIRKLARSQAQDIEQVRLSVVSSNFWKRKHLHQELEILECVAFSVLQCFESDIKYVEAFRDSYNRPSSDDINPISEFILKLAWSAEQDVKFYEEHYQPGCCAGGELGLEGLLAWSPSRFVCTSLLGGVVLPLRLEYRNLQIINIDGCFSSLNFGGGTSSPKTLALCEQWFKAVGRQVQREGLALPSIS